MRNLLIILVLVFGFNITVLNSYAEEKGVMIRLWEKVSARWAKDESAQSADAGKPQPVVEKIRPEASEAKTVILSRDALIEEILSKIRQYPELVETMPELSMRKSMDDNIDYYYKLTSDIPMKLTKFDRTELASILDRITKKIPLLPAKTPEKKEPTDMIIKKPEPVEALTEEDVKFAEPERPEIEIPYTKGEMLDVIYKRLHTFSQIAYMIPDFSMVQNEDGTRQYYYYTDEGQIAIEDLDKGSLHRLFVRINNEATILNTQRIMGQIQQQEQLTRTLQQQQQQVQRSIQDQRPPVHYTPPVVHTPPPQPPRQPPQQPQQPQR